MTLRLSLLVCAFVLYALGPGFAQTNDQTNQEISASQEFTIVANAPPGGPGDLLWRMFEDSVTEKSEGRIELAMLVHGQIGGDELVIQAVRRNRGQMAIVGESGFAQVVPEVSVINMPYLFDGPEQSDFVVDGYVTPAIKEMAAARDLEFLQWIEIGWMNLYGKVPLLTLEDTNDYRMRALPYDTSRAFLAAIGADVINLSSPDVIQGLQTGLIDGGESSTLMYARAGFYEEAQHLTLTRHAYAFSALVANKPWLDALSAEDRAIMTTSFPDEELVRRDTRASLVQELDSIEQEGVVVHQLNSQALQPWIDRAQSTHEDLINRIGGDAQRIYDLVQEGKAVFADQAEAGTASGGG